MKSKRHNNEEDGKLFDSSTVDMDEVNNSNALANDLEYSKQYLLEPKNLKPKVDSDDERFHGCTEKTRHEKKLLTKKFKTQMNFTKKTRHKKKLFTKKFKTQMNGMKTTKHESKVGLNKSYSNERDEDLFDSSTTDVDDENNSHFLGDDLECTEQSDQEPKNFKPEVGSDEELFNGCNEKSCHKKKLLNKFITPVNGNGNTKNASKAKFKVSHSLGSEVNEGTEDSEELFDSSTTDIDEVNNLNVLVEDLECTEQSLKETKNGSGTTKHASKRRLNESHLLSTNENTCDICDRCFKNPTKLLAHKKLHSVTPSVSLIDSTTLKKDWKSDVDMSRISEGFRCHICLYEAKQKGTLNRHLSIHSEEKRFTCEYCEFSTRHKCTLLTHNKAHWDIREYECKLCLKKFLTHQNLKVHKLIHTRERPHVCDLCGRAFVQVQHLNTHYLRVHWNVL